MLIGEYEVTGVLGEGGMGFVYAGAHPLIGKRAAIKVLKGEFSAQQEYVDRFLQEARSVNAIAHANIVDIFSFGVLPDGRHYFVMEHLDGESLQERMARDGPMPLRAAIPILRQIAEALDAAHGKGVIHRDLKPANIYLVRERGSSVRVKVLDFGIAKLTRSDQGMTRTGAVIGTPRYMSPEQCRGVGVDHRTDVYAFGIIIHHMLTGAFPFESESLVTLLLMQVMDPPRLPSEFGLSTDLDRILLKALAKEPDHRYAHLEDVAFDLEQIEDSNEIDPGDAIRGEDTTQVTVARAAPPRSRSDVRSTSEEKALEGAEDTLLRSGPRPVSAPGAHAPEGRAAGPGPVPARAAEPARTGGSPSTARPRSSSTITEPLPVDRSSPSGFVEDGGGIKRLIGHSKKVEAIAFSSDAPLLASASADHTIRLWDLVRQRVTVLEGHTDVVHHVSFSSDGRWLASCGKDRSVRIWDAASGEAVRVLRRHQDTVFQVAFSPDGSSLASASADFTACLWDLKTEENRAICIHRGAVRKVVYSPKGDVVASASDDKTVRLWSSAAGKARVLEGHTAGVTSLAFAPNGQRVCSASIDRTVRVWILASGASKNARTHKDVVWNVAYSRDGLCLASGGADMTIQIGEDDYGRPSLLTGHSAAVWGLAFSPDGRFLASASGDRSVRIWSLPTRTCIATIPHEQPVRSVQFSPDGRSVASTSDHSAIVLAALSTPR